MPYSEKARELRRRTQPKVDGQPCRAWVVWGDTLLTFSRGQHIR